MSHEILKNSVRNYIHDGKQFPEGTETALLTVNRIGILSSRGSLDFGGGEYSTAEIKWLEPKKKSPDDKYGWWHLEEGRYMVEFNESLQATQRQRFYLQPWSHVAQNGVCHNCVVLIPPQETLQVYVSVGPAGIDIKENARFSELGVLDE